MRTRAKKQGILRRAVKWIAGLASVAAAGAGCTGSVAVMNDTISGPRKYTTPESFAVGAETEGSRARFGLNVEYQRSGVEGNPAGVDQFRLGKQEDTADREEDRTPSKPDQVNYSFFSAMSQSSFISSISAWILLFAFLRYSSSISNPIPFRE